MEEEGVARKRVQAEGELLIIARTLLAADPSFRSEILAHLKNDQISFVAKYNELILKVSYHKYEKKSLEGRNDIMQEIRRLGRLLLELRKISNSEYPLSKFIAPNEFDTVVQAVKTICGSKTTEDHRPEYEIPSLALKYGHSLGRCAVVVRGEGIRNGDEKKKADAKYFKELIENEWSHKVSSVAVSTLSRRKPIESEILPVTEDVLLVQKYVIEEIKNLLKELEKRVNEQSWIRLSNYYLTRLIMFNRRRSGEASKLLVSNYRNMKTWAECSQNKELADGLSKMELSIAKSMHLLTVIGKWGKVVPILLTPEMKEAMDFIWRTRSKLNVSPNNIYFFARTNRSLGHLRGNDALRLAVEECPGVKRPDFVKSTALRKIFATVCQLKEMKSHELESVARHLGHSVDIHKIFYRIHSDTTEMSKVATAAEKGLLGQQQGMPINEVNLTGIELDHIREEKIVSELQAGCSSDPEFLANSERKEFSPPRKRNPRKFCTKIPWTTPEKKAVLNYFRSPIKYGIIPRKDECEKVKKRELNTLKRRTWKDIKFFVHNTIQKRKKIRNTDPSSVGVKK